MIYSDVSRIADIAEAAQKELFEARTKIAELEKIIIMLHLQNHVFGEDVEQCKDQYCKQATRAGIKQKKGF